MLNLQFINFAVDSRKIERGGLFFAIKGERVDGHNFLEEVAQRGATAALVSKEYRGKSFGLKLFFVDDVLNSMRLMAKKKVESLNPTIIGVTGSVGKTTTKEFIFSMLKGKWRVEKSLKNLNSQVSLPLTILNRADLGELLVLEMGMSEAGEIRKLIDIAPPAFAVITKVCLAHVLNFKEGEKGIARAKAEILESTKLKGALINLEVVRKFPDVFEKKRFLTFSMKDSGADFYWNGGSVFENGREVEKLDFPFKESHFLENLLAALSLGRILGMEWRDLKEKIKDLSFPEMRFERIEREGVLFINDAYNANPTSVRAAIENLPPTSHGGKRIFVLGAMKELGAFSKVSHTEIAELALKNSDHALFLGEEWNVVAGLNICVSREEIALHLKKIVQRGDVVLVKGSHSLAMEKIFDLLKFNS